MAVFAYSIAKNLNQVIRSEGMNEICNMWGCGRNLQRLKTKVYEIMDILYAAASKREHSVEQEVYIAELKEVVYDADDLFDEFRTLVDLNLIGGDMMGAGGKLSVSGEVRSVFRIRKRDHSTSSSSKKVMSNQSHRFNTRLDKIIFDIYYLYDRSRLVGSFIPSSMPLQDLYVFNRYRQHKNDSSSYVVENDIIGRDKDKDAILDMLLAPNGDDEDFRFLTIVGVAGLGKTTLTQLVFNDENIQKEFSSSRFWVCVSDQGRVELDVKTILSKILQLATNVIINKRSSVESVQNQFVEQFKGKKYLLVLDDVCRKHLDSWVELKRFLMIGARGSKIVLTSRSKNTASITGSKHVYNLERLSKQDSQYLFEMLAFEGEKHPELVMIGENIATKCCGIPLAIKVVGSLLYGQDISRWQSIEGARELTGIGNAHTDNILPILKLCYNDLAPSVKSCFSYCVVFPKDSRMDKEKLIGHWMAQGYIVPLYRHQSVEDAAEEHFTILMRRCLFQDILKDAGGNVVSVKIHDLMHDVAQEVGNDECCVVSSKTSILEKNVHHVNIVGDKCAKIFLCNNKIRTYICNDQEDYLRDKPIDNLISLRVLDLSYIDIGSLPETIEKLLFLRYLNLQNNQSLEVLPVSVTRLYNLQTLILRGCRNLIEVPRDFSILKNLRYLDLYGCRKLNEMPLGMSKWTKLRILPYFLVSDEISEDELQVLRQVFTKLKGKVCITGRGDSKSMKHLEKITIDFDYNGKWVINEGVLKKLDLPPYLKELSLSRYNGTAIFWLATSLVHYLVRIEITFCRNMEQVPLLSKWPYLKSIKLIGLNSVEYMETGMSSNDTKVVAAADFFPSLESLEIMLMEKWKGWWKWDVPGMKLRFPRLSHLKIEDCPNLISFAPYLNPEHQLPSLCILQINWCPILASNFICPQALEKLELNGFCDKLLMTGEFGKLKDMVIDKVDYLKLLPPRNCLKSLEIRGHLEVESALKRIQCNENLRTLPRLDHLIALEKLHLRMNYELRICEDDEEPWKSFPRSLRKVTFDELPKMISLPKGMQHLTPLQSLKLRYCDNLEGGLPEWMSCLSSLRSLSIWLCQGLESIPEAFKKLTSLNKLDIIDCPHLEKRCKKPNGEDFSKIQHIPHIRINGKRVITEHQQ